MEIQGFLPPGLSNDLPFIEIAMEKIRHKKDIIMNQKVINNGIGVLSSPDYYFFMESTGGHAYLSHLDIKILKQEFGKYCDFPDEIEIYIQCKMDVKLDEVRDILLH